MQASSDPGLGMVVGARWDRGGWKQKQADPKSSHQPV